MSLIDGVDWPNVRIAVRALRRSRGFAAIAIVSLGLAIGLNTTIYSLLDALINPTVGVDRPSELYRIRYFGDVHHRLPGGAIDAVLASGLRGYRGVSGSTRLMHVQGRATVERGAHVAMADPLVVRSNFFSILGTRAAEGRIFSPADESVGQPLVVISDRLATALFPDGGTPIGTTIVIEGQSYGVLGVVHRYEQFPSLDSDCWILASGADAARVPITLVRLRDGVTPASVDNELRVLAARLAVEAGEPAGETRFYLSGRAQRQFELEPIHYALVSAVVVILLVACGNLAALQFARGQSRGSELALRAALGATRRDIIRTLVLENTILAFAGLALGVVMTLWGVHLIAATIPVESAGYIIAPHTSWRTFAVASAATMTALMVVGVWPAWFMSRVDPNSLLKSRAGTGATRAHRRRYALLLALQIGVGVPLLSGGALLLRSAYRLSDPSFAIQRSGYDRHQLVVAQAPVRTGVGEGRLDPRRVASALVARAKTAPGVVDVTATMAASPIDKTITVEEPDGVRREVPVPMWSYTVVSPSYFRTFGRAMRYGSDFAPGEYGAPAVVLEEEMASFLWPGLNPVGRLIKFGDERSSAEWARIVGVVKDGRDTATVHAFDPYYGRHPSGVYRTFSLADTTPAATVSITLYARAKHEVDRVAVGVRHALAGAPEIRQPYVVTYDELDGTRQRRAQADFLATLFSLFSVVAVGLAAVGVYGIVAHSVNERRREFGVRISLGASTNDILLGVLGDGKVFALAGIAVGLFLTRGTASWLGRFLTGRFDLNDAGLFAAIAGVLVVTALLAALGPAWNATRISPVEAMRSE